MAQKIALFLGLVVIWLLLSGFYDNVLLLSFGLFSCILTMVIAQRMDLVDEESVPLQLGFSIVGYWVWLTREIAKANIAVTKAVFSDLVDVRPQMFTYDAPDLSDVGLVTLANSVTLTPGTVTVELVDHTLTIHALTKDAADPAVIKEMDRRLKALGG